MDMRHTGRVNSAAPFARLLQQANRCLGYAQAAKLTHRPLQRTGNPESRGVHSPASILAGRGEESRVTPTQQTS